MDLLPELDASDALRQSAISAFRRPAPPRQQLQPTVSHPAIQYGISSHARPLLTPPSSRPVSPMFGAPMANSVRSASTFLPAHQQLLFNPALPQHKTATGLAPDFITPPSSPDHRLHDLDFGPTAMETPFHMVPDLGPSAMSDLLAVDAPTPHDGAFDELLTLVPDLLTPLASPSCSDSELFLDVDSLDVDVVVNARSPPSPYLPARPLSASGLVTIPTAMSSCPSPMVSPSPSPSPIPRLVSTGTVHNPPRRSRKRRDFADDVTTVVAAASPSRSPKRGRKNGRASKRGGARRSTKSAARSATDRRDSHNVSERQRRKDLKASFEALRTIVPCMANDPKVHTGTILNNAIDFIRELETMDRAFEAKKRALRQENARLRAALGC